MCSITNTKVNIFHNGLKVIYEPAYNKFENTSVYLFCNVGSAFETEETHGFSHFIEHMCFKGTKKFPSYMQLYKYIDETGANLNASTTKRYTVYTMKCNNQHLEIMLKIISEMIFNSVFNKKEYNKEIQVVMEENYRDDDDNYNTVFELIDEIIFKDTGYMCPIDSNKYHKKTPDIQRVKEFYRTFYKPHNMVLSISSALPYSSILRMVKKTQYWKAPAQPVTEMESRTVLYRQPAIYNAIQYKFKRVKNSDVVYVCIGFKTCSLFNKDRYTFRLLKNIMSGYFSALLPLNLREKNGLTYNSDISVDYYESTGYFVIDTVTEHSKLLHNGSKKGVLPTIIGLLSYLIAHGVDNKTFTKGKRNINGKMKMNMENPNTQTNYNGEYLLTHNNMKDYVPYCKLYDVYIDKITTQNIHDLIVRYFKQELMAVAVVAEKMNMSSIKQECEKIRVI